MSFSGDRSRKTRRPLRRRAVTFFGAEDGAATGRDDLSAGGGEVCDGLLLAFAEGGLAALGEVVRDGHTDPLRYQRVAVGEALAQPLREGAATVLLPEEGMPMRTMFSISRRTV